MEKLNLNELAEAVTQREGGKVNLSIAEVKQVIRCTFLELKDKLENDIYGAEAVLAAIRKAK